MLAFKTAIYDWIIYDWLIYDSFLNGSVWLKDNTIQYPLFASIYIHRGGSRIVMGGGGAKDDVPARTLRARIRTHFRLGCFIKIVIVSMSIFLRALEAVYFLKGPGSSILGLF